MRISVGQFRPTGVIEENLEVLRRLTAQAAEEGAGLVVFPEESMLTQRHLVTDTFEEAVDTEWGEFVAALKDMAREHGIAIIAGGYEPSGTPRPYNTLVAVDGSGSELGTYRKLHLYDAFKHKESDTITPGDRDLLSVRIGELTFGLLTCYDLRFPELSRRLAVDGADVLVVPAAWFKGDHKVDHLSLIHI